MVSVNLLYALLVTTASVTANPILEMSSKMPTYTQSPKRFKVSFTNQQIDQLPPDQKKVMRKKWDTAFKTLKANQVWAITGYHDFEQEPYNADYGYASGPWYKNYPAATALLKLIDFVEKQPNMDQEFGFEPKDMDNPPSRIEIANRLVFNKS